MSEDTVVFTFDSEEKLADGTLIKRQVESNTWIASIAIRNANPEQEEFFYCQEIGESKDEAIGRLRTRVFEETQNLGRVLTLLQEEYCILNRWLDGENVEVLV